MAPPMISDGVTSRNFRQCMTLLLASGIGSGVLVIPRSMAAVGYVPAALCFFFGAVLSGTTTWFLTLAILEVRRRWLEEDLKHPLHHDDGHDRVAHMQLAHHAHHAPTTWRDVQEPTSPMSAMSPSLRRSTSFRDFITRVGPSYGDLVEQASPECPWVSTCLDCVLFLHNTMALTVYFLFVSESLERVPAWPANSLDEPYRHVITIVFVAVVGCILSTLPTIGGLARAANVSPFVLWFMMFCIWWKSRSSEYDDERQEELAAFAEGWHEYVPGVLCIAVFASFWHTNCVAIAREFCDATPRRLGLLAFTSSFTLGLLYYFIAFGGYYTWGQKLLQAPNIVSLYHPDDWLFTLVRLFLAFSLSIAIPLNVFPIRESAQNLQLFEKLPKNLRRWLLGSDPRKRHVREHEILGVSLVLIPMALSLCFSNVVQLITILGGTLVSLLMIVFPCIVFRMVSPSKVLFWFCLLSGCCLSGLLMATSWGLLGRKV